MEDFIFKKIVNESKDNIQNISIPLNLLTGDHDSINDQRRMELLVRDIREFEVARGDGIKRVIEK